MYSFANTEATMSEQLPKQCFTCATKYGHFEWLQKVASIGISGTAPHDPILHTYGQITVLLLIIKVHKQCDLTGLTSSVETYISDTSVVVDRDTLIAKFVNCQCTCLIKRGYVLKPSTGC